MFKYLTVLLCFSALSQPVYSEHLDNDGIEEDQVEGKTIQKMTLRLGVEDLVASAPKKVLPIKIGRQDMTLELSLDYSPTSLGYHHIGVTIDIENYVPYTVYDQVCSAYGCELLGKKALDPVKPGFPVFIITKKDKKPTLKIDEAYQEYWELPLAPQNKTLPDKILLRVLPA